MSDDNIIDVDFRKKRVISEFEKEIIPGFTQRQLQYSILKLNFIVYFRDNEPKVVSSALLTMADLTGLLYDYPWFSETIEFFEDYISKNKHWHIKFCENEEKREYLLQEYWDSLIKQWKNKK